MKYLLTYEVSIFGTYQYLYIKFYPSNTIETLSLYTLTSRDRERPYKVFYIIGGIYLCINNIRYLNIGVIQLHIYTILL